MLLPVSVHEGSVGRLVIEDEGDDPAVFLTALHACEAGCARHLTEILTTPVPPISIDVERALAWVERQSLLLATQQREAIRKAITSKVLVITGGPGTGRTTITNAIFRIFDRKGRRLSLCAPTGRAAKRLAERRRRRKEPCSPGTVVGSGQASRRGARPLCLVATPHVAVTLTWEAWTCTPMPHSRYGRRATNTRCLTAGERRIPKLSNFGCLLGRAGGSPGLG